MIQKSLGSATRSVDTKARTIEFVASTSAVDRYGDSIDQSGWDTKNFERNPIFLWSHRSSDPPVGKVIALSKGASLIAKVEFATNVYPFAKTIFDLYAGGFLQAVSVGFLPTESEPLIDDTGRQSGQRFLKQELLEISATPVPANPQALARAVRRGIISRDQRRSLENPVSDAELFERFCQALDREESEFENIYTLDEFFRALHI